MPETDLITVDEAADWLRVSIYMVREMLKEGRLAETKSGGAYQIRRTEIEKMIERQRVSQS